MLEHETLPDTATGVLLLARHRQVVLADHSTRGVGLGVIGPPYFGPQAVLDSRNAATVVSYNQNLWIGLLFESAAYLPR